MQTHRALSRMTIASGGGVAKSIRMLPEEVAVALSFNGTTQAVMMATPADLIDFAYGFALTEGLARPSEIEQIDPVETPKGIDIQIWVTPEAEARLARRRRTMAGPVGCGLCGIDSIDEALRDLPVVPKSSFTISAADVRTAISSLPHSQPLHDATHAVHAAGFWDGHLIAIREDVGRHNALDKLAGHLVRANLCQGAILLTSRVSIDMVQKVAALGAPMIIAVSAPTAHAVAMADAAGITLIGLARADRFDVFTHESRLTVGAAQGEQHVA